MKLLLTGMAILLTALSPSARPATITDLGTLGGNTSAANAINSSGQVAGSADRAANAGQRAFLYSGTSLADLGTLGGTSSEAFGINSAGQVVGYAFTASGGTHAFLFNGTTMADLGTLGTSAGLTSLASGINGSGQVAGSSDLIVAGQNTEHAFLYAAGVMKDLGTLGGNSSRGSGINSSGQLVGDADVKGFTSHAFLYSGGTMKDLGTLGGPGSSASAINDSGQIVGSSALAVNMFDQHAFLYSGGVMKDLGTLGVGSSYATSINAAGQIVGNSAYSVSSGPYPHAFLYSGGVMTDLNSLLPANSGWVLENASSINDAGQIVGTGNIKGQRHAFLLNGATTMQSQSQTITFGPLSAVTLGAAPFTLTATASSGLAVSFASTTSAVCTVAGNTVTLVAAGTCSITASQPGNAGFQAAAPVTQSFAVNAGSAASPQTITFAPLPDVTSGVAPFAVTATASSGLPVSFAAAPAAVCTAAGSTITITGGGTCSVTASQMGTAAGAAVLRGPLGVRFGLPRATFSAAAPVTQSFAVKAAIGGPAILPGGIGPVYSSSTTIQAGSWISIYGTNLATTTATWNGDFPTSLGGAAVTINGKKAYLWYVSPGQINLQVPDDTTTGTVNVTLTNSKGSWTSTVTLGLVSPSFSLLDAKHVTGIILRSNGSGSYGGGTYDIVGPTGTALGYKTVAAKQGDSLVLFGVGFGPTSPPVPAGQVFSGAAATTSPVQLSIGGKPVTPSFAGLSSAGLYQINLTIPAGLGTGDVTLMATAGGLQTQSTVVLSLQ